MGQGIMMGWGRRRLAAAAVGLGLVVALAWFVVGGPASGEGAAGVVTGDAMFFLRIPAASTALEWVAAAREDAPALDRALNTARDALGYDLLDPDTWRGLAADLEAPLSVALVPSPFLSAVLVISIPTQRGTPVLDGAGLLFTRLPMEVRPRLEQTSELGTSLGRLRVGDRVVAGLMMWEDQLLVGLPVGAGDRKAGIDDWMARTADKNGDRLITEPGVRDALRTHRGAPLLLLCREAGGAEPCVRTPEDPVAAISELFERLLSPSS
ncbi:MAG: hypothetical protein ABIK09_14470 [Pseudomonadota bacterium]